MRATVRSRGCASHSRRAPRDRFLTSPPRALVLLWFGDCMEQVQHALRRDDAVSQVEEGSS
jgi:hypothetical protein